MNEALEAPLTMEEVRNAIFQIAPTKALGLDELNGQFYHHYWISLKQACWTQRSTQLTLPLLPKSLT